MSNILFFIDSVSTHTFRTLKVSKKLENKGHKVIYVGFPESIDIVRKYGFKCYYIVPQNPTNRKQYFDFVCDLFENSVFDQLINKYNPKVILFTTCLRLEALVCSDKISVPIILFHTVLRPFSKPHSVDLFIDKVPIFSLGFLIKYIRFLKKSRNKVYYTLIVGFILGKIYLLFRRRKTISLVLRYLYFNLLKLDSFAYKLNVIKEFIVCPKEFDFPHQKVPDNVHYIESSINDLEDDKKPIILPKNKKIIFVSIGTQERRSLKILRIFYKKILLMIRRFDTSDWYFVFSNSRHLNLTDAENLENVLLLGWVNQLSILKYTSLSIFHGGLSTTKECIYFSVPMLVSPLSNDAFINEKLIKLHGLGDSFNISKITPEILYNKIRELLSNEEIKINCKIFQKIFHEYEDSSVSVNLIEKVIENS